MERFKNISIQKKILISMLTFTLIPIMLVSAVATTITYRTMRDQLIYDHRMSSGWLQDRMNAELKDMVNQFYEFEVNKSVRNDIMTWCGTSNDLDYEAQWRIITVMNTAMNIDSSIKSIELFNLKEHQVLLAERSGAQVYDEEQRLEFWNQRDQSLQNNLVYLRGEEEIVVFHLIHKFENNQPIALLSFHISPHQIRKILEEIKTIDEETIIVFNDENEIIEADYGSQWDTGASTVTFIRNELAQSDHKEAAYDGQFWFYRSVSNGKLQLLLSVPNQTIINALLPTMLSSIIVAVIAVFASVICSVIYSRAVTRPIKHLSDEMKTITLNDYSGHTAQNRKDEIGILQDSFEYMLSRNKELITQQYQAKLETRNAQLRALQAQINPHFMYNTLQVIGGMALEKNAPEIYQITVALSDIMRYSLNFSKEMVTLSEEIEYLKSYVMIQNERFGGKVHLEISLAPETEECLIPKLILQPLAENSFEHGLHDKLGEWVIVVESCITQQGDLLLTVKDNGIGFQEDRLREIQEKIERDAVNALKSGSHIGLSNVHARIKLRSPKEQYGLKIHSSPETGTIVSVCMQRFERGEDKP